MPSNRFYARLGVIAASLVFAATSAVLVASGRPAASSVRLQDVGGSPIALADFRGKVVVLNFTDSATKLLPPASGNLDLLCKRWGTDRRVQVFQIATENASPLLRRDIASARDACHRPYTVALDPARLTPQMLGLEPGVEFAILDARGNIAYAGPWKHKGRTVSDRVLEYLGGDTSASK